MHKRMVTLIEQPGGRWLHAEHDRTYASAKTAVRAIKADDKLVAETKHAVATIITYRPNTNEGTAEVNRLIRAAQASFKR